MRYILTMLLSAAGMLFAFTTHDLITIKGKVTDENGNPVAGATVVVKGTKTATSTDQNGEFIIQVPGEKAVLVISWVGYETKEIRVKEKRELMISLKPVEMRLEEVVVTGYATTKRKDILGSVTVPAPNKNYNHGYFNNQLQGKAAGVYIQGAPGTKKQVRIRGNNSFNNNYDTQALHNTEGYDNITENRFLKVSDNPLSTFSIDVDAASYSNVRRFLQNGQLPPAGAVRIEEMINYFQYDYPQPQDEHPFTFNTEMAECPWNKEHKLVLIGLQGKKIETDNLPASNLVFLIDVSGSMMDANKLPLVKASMKMLTDQLRPQDKVAMVVYAGAAGLVLPSTQGSEKIKIKTAIDALEAGGSTAGGAGIKLAYKTAKENFITDGNNRVILCTDGDFNVGASSDDDMIRLIGEERKSGVFLTVLGYGMGNYQDAKMQKLADKGNGNHAYIDQLSEAKKVLVNEFGGTLFTIAKDVKLQIEFNPLKVQAYRLIGYENRILSKEDFNNDKKDAGDLGSGHTVTALYEVIPVGVKSKFIEKVDPLKYQKSSSNVTGAPDELLTIKFRYKKPNEDKSRLIEHAVKNDLKTLKQSSDNFRFAASVAQFGMLLRNSEFMGRSNYNNVIQLAKSALGKDGEGYRQEFLKMAENAMLLAREADNDEDEDVAFER
jgi:Ca-activated chloride channel homolog